MGNPWRALFLIGALYGVIGLCGAMAFGLDFEGTAEFTTQPRFEVRGQHTYLILTNQKHSGELLWSMEPKIELFPVKLDTNRVYVFSVTNRVYVFNAAGRRDIRISRPELRIIQQDGKTIYDVAVCEVHKARMEDKEVRIIYGLFRRAPGEPPADVEQQSFPHSREYSLGGCVGLGVNTESIYVCADCKRAYNRWKAENRGSK